MYDNVVKNTIVLDLLDKLSCSLKINLGFFEIFSFNFFFY